MNIKNALLFFLLIGFIQNEFAQVLSDTISAYVAAKRIDEVVIIKAKVVTVFYAENSTGKPTFLNLEQPFPNNPIVVVIFENELKKLNINAQDYIGKHVYINGVVKLYKDEAKPFKYKPSITIYNKNQLIIIATKKKK